MIRTPGARLPPGTGHSGPPPEGSAPPSTPALATIDDQTTVAFFAQTPMGSNAVRLAALFAGPIALCAATIPRRRVTRTAFVILLLLLAFWQWSSGVRDFLASQNEPSAKASYYQPLLRFLATQRSVMLTYLQETPAAAPDPRPAAQAGARAPTASSPSKSSPGLSVTTSESRPRPASTPWS